MHPYWVPVTWYKLPFFWTNHLAAKYWKMARPQETTKESSANLLSNGAARSATGAL